MAMFIRGVCFVCNVMGQVRVVMDLELDHYIGLCPECERKRERNQERRAG